MKNLVWIASYPRSGNTWFRIFLSRLISGNRLQDLNNLSLQEIANSRIMFDELSGISSSDLMPDEINNLKPVVYSLLSDQSKEIIYIKSHEQYRKTPSGVSLFPAQHSLGCIYIVRNPLDVTVSTANYFGVPVDQVISNMNNPSQMLHASTRGLWPLLEEHLGRWSEHVESWLHCDLPLHVIRYEDMKENPLETFTSALDFLQLKYNEDQLREAIHDTSFGKLQEFENANGFREKLQGGGRFFKSGQTGTWQDELTADQIKKITTNHSLVMKMFDYS